MLDFQYLYSMKIKLSEEQLKRLVKSTLGEQNFHHNFSGNKPKTSQLFDRNGFAILDLRNPEHFNAYQSVADKYISTRKANHLGATGYMFANAALQAQRKYKVLVPVELALAQMNQEGGFSVDKTVKPIKTINPFNIGNVDSGATKKYSSVSQAINSYYDLMASKYLKNKSVPDLLKNFVDYRGLRYASDANYETKVADTLNYVKNISSQVYTNLRKKQNVTNKKEGGFWATIKDMLSENRPIQSDIEEEYPTTWNVEEFARLKSFNQRIQYCEKNLTRISSGSSRIAYKIDDTKVLKLAKNKKGLAQNEAEIDYSQDYMMDDIVAQVFNYDENNLWLEMELARKLTPAMFQNLVGFTFEEYVDGIWFEEDRLKPRKSLIKRSKPERFDEMWENDFISKIFDIMGSYENFMAGDLTKLSTYGVVTRDNQDTIVLIDFGLTQDVYDSHYKK